MKCGLGVRPELFEPIANSNTEFGFLEAHSENYFGDSVAKDSLLKARENYPISLHGVGLSLGRADDLNHQHLLSLRELVNQIQPILVSEHLAWSAYSHRHVPDLLPLPLTDDALNLMCAHVDHMQSFLGQQILVENPSNYLVFDQLQIPEPEFLNLLAHRTGCGLLIDVNNIHVSAFNVRRNAKEYIDSLNSQFVYQYHLAGYTEVTKPLTEGSERVLIDTHNQSVSDKVWGLFEYSVERHGAKPTLLEWDSDFPEFEVLVQECCKADTIIAGRPTEFLSKEPTFMEQEYRLGDLASVQEGFLDQLFHLDSALQGAMSQFEHRISIYQNNVFAAIQDYMAEVFPASRGVVGADYFKQMIQQLIQTSPPKHGNIHRYGRELIAFTSSFDDLNNMPYLVSLMEYEWSIHCAFFADVSMGVDAQAYPQNELLSLSVEFNDSVALLDTSYPIYEIHQQSLPDFSGEVGINLGQSEDLLLVYKVNNVVHRQCLDRPTFLMLLQVEKSDNILQAIEALQSAIKPDAMSAALALMFNAKLLQAVQ